MTTDTEKHKLQEFLIISFDRLDYLGACNDGLVWFFEAYGRDVEVPLIEVAAKIPDEYVKEWLCWYFIECNFTEYVLPRIDMDYPILCFRELMIEEIYELECSL